MGPFDPESAELPEAPGYRVIAPVGAGSRGVVFRARDLASQELVALKILTTAYVASLADAPGPGKHTLLEEAAARRSIDDLRAHLAAVDAPGLVKPRRVVEVTRGGEGDAPALAFVMEFVDGDSLARALQRNVRFAPERAAGIARDAAAALRPAHAAGFVHGGLHPGKVLLGKPSADKPLPGRGGELRLLGTGLGETLPGEFERAGAGGGTSPHVYAADEVLAGDRPSETADVFSLGAILYHLLTGLPPYKSRGLGALKVERADGPLVWPRGAMDEFPPKLIRLVDRMTAAAPSGRPRLDHALLAELASAPRSRISFRALTTRGMGTRDMGTRVEPPRDVAPLDEPLRVRSRDGPLRRVASGIVALLGKPSAAAVVIGGATVVFLLALAVALRPAADDANDAASSSEAPVASAPEARDAPRPSVPPEAAPVPDLDRAELEAVEQVFEANPADAEAYRVRIEELAGRAGDVGVRATSLLAGLDRHRERRAEKELARILDRAAALEAAGGYGRVLALLKGFPHDRYPGTAASARARVEAEAVHRRAAESFAGVERRVRDLLVAGDFAGARAEYESVRNTIGLDDLVERAEEGLRRVGRLEEEAAEAEARRRAKVEVESVERDIRRAFTDLARLCRTFRYTEAEQMAAAALGKIDLALEDISGPAAKRIAAERKILDDYGELVRWEAAQFRRVAERIRSCGGRTEVHFGGPPIYAIRAISERGLTVTEGEGEIEFLWDRVQDEFAYQLMMEVCGKRNSLAERLAVAVFAHHRGMAEARDEELRVAAKLARTPARKAIVRQVREILDRINAAP